MVGHFKFLCYPDYISLTCSSNSFQDNAAGPLLIAHMRVLLKHMVSMLRSVNLGVYSLMFDVGMCLGASSQLLMKISIAIFFFYIDIYIFYFLFFSWDFLYVL